VPDRTTSPTGHPADRRRQSRGTGHQGHGGEAGGKRAGDTSQRAETEREEEPAQPSGRSRIVARGPKAAGVVRGLGLRVWGQSADERTSGILAVLGAPGGIDGPDLRAGVRSDVRAGGGEPLRIAVQRHGGDDGALLAALAANGAEVIEVPVYRWRVPDDPRPAVSLVDAAVAGSVNATRSPPPRRSSTCSPSLSVAAVPKPSGRRSTAR